MTKTLTILFCLMFTVAVYAARYTDNGDGTVSDNLTGLIWVKDGGTAGARVWTNAIPYCSNLVFATYDDWRSPSVAQGIGTAEFDTLFRVNGNPSGTWEGFAGTPFINISIDYRYWSGVVDAPDFSAYAVDLYNGNVASREQMDANRVIPVRGTYNPPLPSKPTNPIPTNNATSQPTNTVVSWQDGGMGWGYIINFGISNAMTNCGSVATTNYNPGILIKGSNYQWRIDATNISGIATGDVWAFTVIPPPLVLIISGPGRAKMGGTGVENIKGYVR